MKFKVTQRKATHHKDVTTALGWSATNELLSASDDKTIAKWDIDGELLGELCTTEEYVTDMHWFPSNGKGASDQFAISTSEGGIILIGKDGRVGKKVQGAHHGAVISLRWNHDGSALVTAGEDGAVKTWSRVGRPRSTISQTAHSVYSTCWGPDNDQILFSSGREILIKSDKKVGAKQLRWKAHDGVVMKVDWNPVNGLIVSCGEDRRYKVWDSFGRQLYQSMPGDHVLTSVAWCPNGELFAVGSFNLLRLCDKTGWPYSRAKPDSGTLLNLSWSTDGTTVAGAGGNGSVVFGQLIERQLEWKSIVVTLVDSNRLQIQDVVSEIESDIDFRDRIVEFSLGYGYLVVATTTQLYAYRVGNWDSAFHTMDLRSGVSLIVQCSKHFLMVDRVTGIQLVTYDGRILCNPRYPGLRVEILSKNHISVSNDSVAILDRSDNKTVRLFASGGRALGVINHTHEISEIALSNYATSPNDRLLSFIDSNRDLYITPLMKQKPYKLSTMVDTMCWNDVSDMLTCIADGELVTWLYPGTAFVDQDLLHRVRVAKSGASFGKIPQITTFFGSKISVRRADGALLTDTVSGYAPILYDFVSSSRWNEAIRLCRFVKHDELWASLAGMAINALHLDSAEIALAAIDEVAKLKYILYIKEIPSEAGRNAAFLLYKRLPDEAEQVLLQASPPLVYRAIKLNIRLYRWSRALQIATQHKTHVDTVLGYRQLYLDSIKRKESNERFIQYSEQVKVDWDIINAKKREVKEDEKANGSFVGEGK